VSRNSVKSPSKIINASNTERSPKSRPNVTVVVTCYNQGHFLPESIGSILSQTRLPDEIVLVDDGSTDNTRDKVRCFPEVSYIRQDNSGLAAARNTGLRRSRGDLLVFLDADDRLLPTHWRRDLTISRLIRSAVLFSGRSGESTQPEGFWQIAPPCARWERTLIWVFSGTTRSACTPPRCFAGVLEAVGGYDISLPACEDYDLYLKIARRFPSHQHARLVAEYRMHPGQMSVRLSMMLKTAKRVLLAQRGYSRKRHLHQSHPDWH
jgi:GT2 family glycosyltransferase